MKIEENYNLSDLNTFGVNVNAKFFVEINEEKDLKVLFSTLVFKENERIFLGGGSNVLFTQDFDGIVVLNKLRGIEILETPAGENYVFVRVLGGVIWQDFVEFAVNRGYWGVENLALIPGTVGAAPMQNIGAYGAELKNILENVEVFEVETGIKKVFSQEECALGYRESVFKNKLKGKYFISAVTFRLDKKEKKNITYKVLREYLETNHIKVQGPKDISEAVMAIRRSKLPDPKITGNAGSFFKNVFVRKGQLEVLLTAYPEMPHFVEDGTVKIPAGWLIEKCGWKGRRVGRVGVHERQALVLVNYGGATGLEIVELARRIIESVKEKFNLELVPEVNIV